MCIPPHRWVTLVSSPSGVGLGVAKLEQFGWWLPAQEPSVVHRNDQSSACQLGHGGSYGGTLGGYQIGGEGVGYLYGYRDAVWADVTPAVGQVPEQHLETKFNPRMVDDRDAHRQVSRAF